MTYEEALQQLTEAFRRPLPGHDRFLQMSGYPRPDLDQVRGLIEQLNAPTERDR